MRQGQATLILKISSLQKTLQRPPERNIGLFVSFWGEESVLVEGGDFPTQLQKPLQGRTRLIHPGGWFWEPE